MFFMLAFLSGCHRNGPRRDEALAPDDSPLSSVATEIQSLGYRVEGRFVSPPTPWEISTFRMRSRRLVSFKAEQRLPHESENYYVRFTLSEETYDSDNDARQRLADLHREFHDGPVEDEYTRTLRDGFRVGAKTYILQTGAAIFFGPIRNLTKTLVGSIDGAERARAFFAAPPNKSLDRSAAGVFRNLIDGIESCM
jgi:hypothetical protein